MDVVSLVRRAWLHPSGVWVWSIECCFAGQYTIQEDAGEATGLVDAELQQDTAIAALHTAFDGKESGE